MTPVVYLHGFASGPDSSKAAWFRRGLEVAGARVIVPDLAEGDFEHLTVSRQLEVILRAAPPGPVSLIGSSLGGYLAALYAARHTEVERVVLLAPAFGFTGIWRKRLDAAELDRWRDTGLLEVYHYVLGRNAPIGYGLFSDALRYEDEPDFPQPALIFHGAHDDVVPVAGSEHFAALHPNAALEIVDSGHDLLDVLDSVVPQAISFLSL
jgi:pimeloyl-ACP methyl ester carboxylesterase